MKTSCCLLSTSGDIMKKMNISMAIVFILVSCYVLITAQTYPGEIDHVPGPGYFPTILAAVIIFLALLLIVSSRAESDLPLGVFSRENSRVFISGGITAAYLVCIYVFGFIWATPVYLACMFRFFGQRKWSRILLIAGLTTLVTYGVFTEILEVQLPAGLFGE